MKKMSMWYVRVPSDDAVVDEGALRWCREHNALVRFHSNKTVQVKVNNRSRRRSTLVEAVTALQKALALTILVMLVACGDDHRVAPPDGHGAPVVDAAPVAVDAAAAPDAHEETIPELCDGAYRIVIDCGPGAGWGELLAITDAVPSLPVQPTSDAMLTPWVTHRLPGGTTSCLVTTWLAMEAGLGRADIVIDHGQVITVRGWLRTPAGQYICTGSGTRDH